MESMVKKALLDGFYDGRRVLVTGHTGFKGSWLCKILTLAGAKVVGYALEPPTTPSLFDIAEIGKEIESHIGDIADYEALLSVFQSFQPEIVIHMAAQPLVIEGYKNPRLTYETNVMGTVNLLECVRHTPSVRSVLNVTTDKVYLNREWEWGYRESERLDGFDPYSNSKSCSELVTATYIRSFFTGPEAPAVSTARAGNVIGGGDFADNRIIPDCVRAAISGEELVIRNPYSTRPYQHVLEPLYAYLMIAAAQYSDRTIAGNYNVGPDDEGCYTTGALVDLFAKAWGPDFHSRVETDPNAVHEARFLRLDCSKLKNTFDWHPRWTLPTAVQKVAEWTRAWQSAPDITPTMEKQIVEFLS